MFATEFIGLTSLVLHMKILPVINIFFLRKELIIYTEASGRKLLEKQTNKNEQKQ
jgi:hypothetical protein